MKDVTDLIGQLEALTIKFSPRWYNIVERNRRHTLDKKETNRKQRRIEYKSDNIVVRHSFFNPIPNPRWTLSHVDDMLDILENHADECDMKRILRGYEYYLLPADNEDPVFVEKRNRVIQAFVDFVTLFKEREKNREYSDSD